MTTRALLRRLPRPAPEPAHHAFRIFTIIPIAIIVALLEHISFQARRHWFEVPTAGGAVVLPRS